MRSPQEIFALLQGIAQSDPRIRGLYLNGSRANPSLAPDQFQDFDVVFIVTHTLPFIQNTQWLSVLGERIITQEPDSPAYNWGQSNHSTDCYTWLMLFTDGNRIDLKIVSRDYAKTIYGKDSLTHLLLDKDGTLPHLPPPSDSSYHIQPPTKAAFDGCCNEFWWCLGTVAKGIARGQMPYALRMYYCVVHVELDKMMEWYIGTQRGYGLTTGMWGKYFKDYAPKDIYTAYEKTYAACDGQALWEAVFTACTLFETLGEAVAKKEGHSYPKEEAVAMVGYLKWVSALGGCV